MPVLLAVAAFALQTVDWFPPTFDEFYSMYDVGWVDDHSVSPVDIVRTMIHQGINHMPLFYVILNQWGFLVGEDILLARVLTILIALLSLAMTYRLARDFVTPTAGFFAAILLASNAYYNVYIPHARMYPLLLLVSALVVWIYLRITYSLNAPKRSDFWALFAAGCVLLYIHAYGVFLVGVLGLFHLILAPRSKTWLTTILVALAALAVFALWLPVLLKSLDAGLARWGSATTDAMVALWKFFEIATNNLKHLLIVPALGLAFDYARARRIRPVYIIAIIYWIALAALAQFTELVSPRAMRFFLTGLPITIVVLAAGLDALFRYRSVLGLLVLLWVATGLSFQQSGYIDTIVAGRANYFDHVPWQIVSRQAKQQELQTAVFAFQVKTYSLKSAYFRDFSREEYFFGDHGIDFHATDDLDSAQAVIDSLVESHPVILLAHQSSNTSTDEATALAEMLAASGYRRCHRNEEGIDTVISLYRWTTLAC